MTNVLEANWEGDRMLVVCSAFAPQINFSKRPRFLNTIVHGRKKFTAELL